MRLQIGRPLHARRSATRAASSDAGAVKRTNENGLPKEAILYIWVRGQDLNL